MDSFSKIAIVLSYYLTREWYSVYYISDAIQKIYCKQVKLWEPWRQHCPDFFFFLVVEYWEMIHWGCCPINPYVREDKRGSDLYSSQYASQSPGRHTEMYGHLTQKIRYWSRLQTDCCEIAQWKWQSKAKWNTNKKVLKIFYTCSTRSRKLKTWITILDK